MVELHGESLAGHVNAADGEMYAFTGWIGLLNVLQALLSPSHDAEFETT